MKPEDIEREVGELYERVADQRAFGLVGDAAIKEAFRSYLEEKGPLFAMWVKGSDRLPDQDDSDDAADVVTFDGSSLGYVRFNGVDESDYWLPCPNITSDMFDQWFKSQQFQVDDQTKEVMRKAFEAGKTQE